MAITKTLTGSIAVLDLNPNGTLRASNVERHYVLADGATELARPIERDVLTADMLAGLLPDQAALLLQVQTLEAELAAATALVRDRVPAAPEQPPSRSISPLQARKALKASGRLAAVQALVAAAPEDDDVRLAWDWALTWERDSPFIDTLGAALGLTGAQIDELFALAATL